MYFNFLNGKLVFPQTEKIFPSSSPPSFSKQLKILCLIFILLLLFALDSTLMSITSDKNFSLSVLIVKCPGGNSALVNI